MTHYLTKLKRVMTEKPQVLQNYLEILLVQELWPYFTARSYFWVPSFKFSSSVDNVGHPGSHQNTMYTKLTYLQ